MLYIGGEKENTKDIKLFNSRPKVSQTEVKLLSSVQLFLEYGFIFYHLSVQPEVAARRDVYAFPSS